MTHRRRFPGSIREQILLPYLALTVTMVVVTGLACGRWAAERAREQYLERGRGIAQTLQRSSFPLTAPILAQLKGLGGAEFVLIDGRGRVAASTLPGPAGPGPVAGGPDLSFDARLAHGGIGYRIATVDRPRGASAEGPRRLLILLPEPALRAAEWEALRAAGGLSLVGAGLAAAMASWVGRRLSRPLSAILRAIRLVGQGERRPEGLPTAREDEIGELAEGVARLAERLGELEGERALNERLRLIRQVSAGLAHELRNPLTAARMTLQLFMERNPDRDAEPLRIALTELNRMERQVRRFLQIARPDPPRFEDVDVGAVLDGVAQGLAAQAAHQGVRLEVEYPEGMPPAWADADQVGQVATNLAMNALDAAGPGGSVRLAARPEGAGRLAIVVEDDGPGIPASEAPRLFQPFFTTTPEGVGLGLALCDALVREHGGSIRHERADGRTRFLVRLPTAHAPAAVPAPVPRVDDGPPASRPLAPASAAG